MVHTFAAESPPLEALHKAMRATGPVKTNAVEPTNAVVSTPGAGPIVASKATPIPGGATPGVSNSPASPERVQVTEKLDDHQKLGPGDRITYRVIEDQDDPRALTVTDSGDVEVPYLGLVHAAGRTSLQLAREIKALLEKKLYYQATVIIAVELVNKTRVSGKVYVTGQVRNRGGYEIPAGENFTVSKAILSAGGFSDFSDKKHVRLIRNTPEGERTYIVNVVDVWEKSKLSEDMVVKPDDTVVVPARLINY
jgi:protein involved in polysaccharide export with SLBB domain